MKCELRNKKLEKRKKILKNCVFSHFCMNDSSSLIPGWGQFVDHVTDDLTEQLECGSNNENSFELKRCASK